ncbi:MAG: hypothetical protein SFV23_13990, partial [Planctomycetaceae bacterium]|nr:hypothetical protein [Planctomycetaceae bacterium]
MSNSHSTIVKDYFDSSRPSGDFVCTYKDWWIPLSDGTTLTGCVSKYVVIQRLGVAYFELYLGVYEPERCRAIILALLDSVLTDPQFLLPYSMR